MRHSKWLLVVVIILLAINVIFYALWYALDIKGKVNHKLEAYLSKTLKGTFSIQKLSINDRHVTANNISFIDKAKNIHVNIRQVQIRYNLFKILISGLKVNKVVDQITVYDPVVTVKIDNKPKAHKKPLKIPDLIPYFRNLDISNGSINVIYTTPVDKSGKTILIIEEKLHSVNLVVRNRKVTLIKLTTHNQQDGTVNLVTSLDKGRFINAKLKLDKLRPTSVQLTGFADIGSELNTMISFHNERGRSKPSIEFSSVFRNSTVKYDKYALQTPYIYVNGNTDRIVYDLRALAINNNLISSKGIVKHPLAKLSLQSKLHLQKLDLSEIDKNFKGIVTGTADVSGELKAIKATGHFNVPTASYDTESLSDLSVDASYSGDSLSFVSNQFTWREQASSVSGYYHIKSETLSLNVKTNPRDISQQMQLNSDLAALIDLSNHEINADIKVNNISLDSPYANIHGLNGSATLNSAPTISKDINFNFALDNNQGVKVEANGELSKLNLKSVVTLDSVYTYEYSPYLKKQKVNSALNGKIVTELNGKQITGNSVLYMNMRAPSKIRTNTTMSYSYNIGNKLGAITFTTDDSYVNNSPFELSFKSDITPDYLKMSGFNLDNTILADGWLNLHNTKDFGIKVQADSVSFTKYWQKFNQNNKPSPLSSFISLNLDYNSNHNNRVAGFIKADSSSFQMIKPINVYTEIDGTTTKVDIKTDIKTTGTSELSVQGSVTRSPKLGFDLQGQFNAFKLQDILTYANTGGALNGSVKWTLHPNVNSKTDSNFLVDITGNQVVFQGFQVDSLLVKVNQLNDLLNVEQLKVSVGEYLNLSGNGSLDYNIVTNDFSNGNHALNLEFHGDVLKWLDRKVKYVEDGKSKVNCQLVVKASEDGLMIENGVLSISNGMIKLKDQVEKINNIDLKSRITNNQWKIDNFNCQIGNGKLYIRNEFDSGGDNFFVGPLNLGYLLIKTDNQGIQISMPAYMPPNTTATAVIKGQKSKEATIKGPFDDMAISAEVHCSNGSALYPADTNNLMQLLNFFHTKAANPEVIPMPFTLDLMVILKDNVRYVTYPANLRVLPESFLHLTYDGTVFNAPDAEFQSEEGTLDFYGSVFNVEFVKLLINQKQNIVSLNGTFTRKAPDGTMITLTVFTNVQKKGDLANQLEFKLSSDNPEDKTPVQILSRLRYDRNLDELTPEQKQSLLQDEAMQVIGASVNSAYVSQWLSPVENAVRRFLKLDTFTISTGFIQNIYLRYGTNTSYSNPNGTLYNDPRNSNSGLAQLGSTVLLNNLALSMGKSLGKGIFLDYQIQMQEATDLAQKTKLVLYHNTTLRYNLPWKLRLSYTYRIKPLGEPNSHEVMVQRSFRF